MKQNKAISLNFNISSKASVKINVPFTIKSIHTKSACYSSGGVDGLGDQIYRTLTSDLTNGEPLAALYGDTRYSSQQFCDVSFVPYKPITIGGEYNFYLLNPDGTESTPTTNDYVNLILEFNGIDTHEH